MKFPGLIALVAAVHIGAQSIPVEERTLPNGMRLLMVERPGEGSIVCAWVAKVGSAHDGLETTGLAHMLEHMMFKGTRTLGTRNAVRDQELNAQQDTLQKQLRKELEPLREQQRRGLLSDPSDPKARTPRMKDLQEAFDKSVQEQKGLAVRNELRTLYTRYGATRMNAGTGSDWTVYMVNVPANKLELWCWLESDRLRDPVFREFYTEREVVREERRTSVEGDPTGEVFESFGAMIWQAHPYQWTMFSAIGWPAPLGQLSREQAERFFRTYYAPNNITAILVGDFKAAEAAPMVEAYFGRIPANPEGVPPLVSVEPPQLGEQRMDATAAVPPAITVAWKAVPSTHRDVPALKVIERLLNGNSGRLERSLVFNSKVAVKAKARLDLRKYAGLVFVEAAPAQGKTAEELESSLYEELGRLSREPIALDELERAKNQFLAAYLEEAENGRSLAWALADAETAGSYKEWATLPERVHQVTAGQVQAAARAYFRKESRTVLTLRRAAAEVR